MVTILSVEDNEMNAEIIHRYLRTFDGQVIDAATGKLGIQLAHAKHPDLILMDINLPDMNGIDVATTIRTLPGMENVPIVAVTADDSIQQQCIEAGFDAYLNKPLSLGSFLRVVNNLIGLQGERLQ
jgi:two-component system, cell cycle response regulator DivK